MVLLHEKLSTWKKNRERIRFFHIALVSHLQISVKTPFALCTVIRTCKVLAIARTLQPCLDNQGYILFVLQGECSFNFIVVYWKGDIYVNNFVSNNLYSKQVNNSYILDILALIFIKDRICCKSEFYTRTPNIKVSESVTPRVSH